MFDIHTLPHTKEFLPQAIIFEHNGFVMCSGINQNGCVTRQVVACRYTHLSKTALKIMRPITTPYGSMGVWRLNRTVTELKTEQGVVGYPNTNGYPQWFILPDCFEVNKIDKTNCLSLFAKGTVTQRSFFQRIKAAINCFKN